LLYRYITKREFPSDSARFRFRTPTGIVELTAYCPEDVVTMFIIFCRVEYSPQRSARVFADFGSNIGISAAFFLSRNRENVVYCYEPNRISIERLRKNLKPFEGRYHLEETCVGTKNGTVSFGIEETGVYCGVGLEHEAVKTVQVQCRNANDIVSEIIRKHNVIDFLKIDIEGLEEAVIKNLSPELLKHIAQIEAETGMFDYQIPGFRKTQYGSIVRYRSIA
jgi:FkbM family methyltransferase